MAANKYSKEFSVKQTEKYFVKESKTQLPELG